MADRAAPLRAVVLALAASSVCAVGAMVVKPLLVHAAGPAMSASPATDLVDGQFVKLTLSGFPPTVGVGLRQCIANPTNVATDCTATNVQVLPVTDANGNSIAYLGVASGDDASLENSGNTGLIACDASHACVIAGVRTNDLTGAVFAPISFAPSTTSCPDPGASAVFGSGAATAYRAMYRWQAAVCVPPASLPIIYAVSNSVDGVNNFGQGQQQANFGVAGPLPSYTLPSTAPSFKFAPITASALVLAYKIYDRRGPQITDLTLTPWLIAQIYEGKIADFNSSPDIQFLNPNDQFPGRVVPYARAEHSAETYVFTSWLTSVLGPGSWPGGAQTIFPQPPTGVTNISGSRGLGLAVAAPSTDWFDQGNMGFMDSSTAAFYGLATVRIREPSGAVVSATPASIAQGLSLATHNSDGTFSPDYTPSDPTAYPMSYPSYLLTPTDQITPSAGKTLAGFLRYAAQSGQASLPDGYVPLPAVMVNQTMDVAGQIPQTTPAPSPTAGPSLNTGPASFGGPRLNGGGGFGASALPNGQASAGTNSCSTLPAPASAGGSAAPAPAPSATPVKPAPASSSASSAPCPTPAARGSSASGPLGPVPLLTETSARFVLPAMVAITLFGVVVGPAMGVLARTPLRFRFRRLQAPRPRPEVL